MTKYARLTVSALIALTSSACVSVNGAPKSVIDVKDITTIPAVYRVAIITEKIGEEPDLMKAKRLRNRAIGSYMSAMDAQYGEFTKALTGESKGWNAGLDISVLGVSSLGAIAKKSSNKLAAFAAFLAGSRTSINKEIYFDRTLSALIIAMDTSRLRAKSTIFKRMQQDIVQYPMELAFSDLSNLELSASIDRAIQQVTIDVSESAKEADEKYKDATESCNPAAAVRPVALRLNHYVYDLAAAADRGKPADGSPEDARLGNLSKIAALVGAKPSGKVENSSEANAQAAAILDATADICSLKDFENLFVTFQGATGEVVP